MIFVWSVWRCHAHKLSEANCHLFIMPGLWPPNSRGLSPVDYKIWDIFSEESARQKCRIWMIWEAASDWCVGWSGTERYWQCHYWPLAQTSLCPDSSQCQCVTFWVLTVTQISQKVVSCNKLIVINLLLNKKFVSDYGQFSDRALRKVV